MNAKRKQTESVSRSESMLRDAIGRGMSPGQCQRLRLAFRLERGSRKERQEADDICKAIETELRAGINETVALERARGGEVEEVCRGPLRMGDRDAVLALVRVKDGLTTAEFEAALKYREACEQRSTDVGSQLGQDAAGGGHNNDRFVLARLRKARALQTIGSVEHAVLTGSYRSAKGGLVTVEAHQGFRKPGAPPPHVGLQVLRAVAAQNIRLSALGEGRAFAKNLAALKIALNVADAVIHGR